MRNTSIFLVVVGFSRLTQNNTPIPDIIFNIICRYYYQEFTYEPYMASTLNEIAFFRLNYGKRATLFISENIYPDHSSNAEESFLPESLRNIEIKFTKSIQMPVNINIQYVVSDIKRIFLVYGNKHLLFTDRDNKTQFNQISFPSDIKQISSAVYYIIVLDNQGRIFIGTTIGKYKTFKQIGSKHQFTQVACGIGYNLLLTKENELWRFGEDHGKDVYWPDLNQDPLPLTYIKRFDTNIDIKQMICGKHYSVILATKDNTAQKLFVLGKFNNQWSTKNSFWHYGTFLTEFHALTEVLPPDNYKVKKIVATVHYGIILTEDNRLYLSNDKTTVLNFSYGKIINIYARYHHLIVLSENKDASRKLWYCSLANVVRWQIEFKEIDINAINTKFQNNTEHASIPVESTSIKYQNIILQPNNEIKEDLKNNYINQNINQEIKDQKSTENEHIQPIKRNHVDVKLKIAGLIVCFLGGFSVELLGCVNSRNAVDFKLMDKSHTIYKIIGAAIMGITVLAALAWKGYRLCKNSGHNDEIQQNIISH